MLKPNPSESDRVRELFEMNTIRKSESESQGPLALSLPSPIEGAPALKPYPRALDKPQRPMMLLPFEPIENTETDQKPQEVPASSHAVARLRHLYALKSNDEAQEKSPEPIVQQDSPDLQNRLRKAQLRLKTVQTLLKVSQSLPERLQEIAQLMSDSFSLWQVQFHLNQVKQSDHLQIISQFTRKDAKVPGFNNELQKQLNKAFESSRQIHFKQTQSQYLFFPLVHRNDKLGVLELVFSPAHNLSADEQLNLKSLSEEIAFYLSEERQLEHDRAFSDFDSLTGLLNHRAFQQQFEAFIKEGAHLPLSLLLIDLDFFRQINEVHGFMQGDQVLQQIADLLSTHLGSDLPLARFGGEEFAILLPNTPLDVALELAGGLRQAIASEKIHGKFNSSLGITASVGVACLNKNINKPRQTMIEQVVAALGSAKDKGRNQVQAYQAPSQMNPTQPLTTNQSERPAIASSVTRPALAPTPKTPPSTPQMTSGPQQGGHSQTGNHSNAPSASATTRPVTPIPKNNQAQPVTEAVVARKWSEILNEQLANLESEWMTQAEDYNVPEVIVAVQQMNSRLQRLIDTLCNLLDHKLKLEELEQLPPSYFMPSPVVAEIRRGRTQLINYEVAFMLLQESLMAVLGKHAGPLQGAIDHFFLCINEKLTQLKSEVQKGS